MAGALSRRDIEMIFRAETDKATRPIADLGKAAKASRGQLEELIEAAAKGDVQFDKLGATTRDLKKAQDELGTARSLLTQLNAQEAALAKAQDKAASAAVKYEELKDAVAGAEAPSKRLVNSMEAAGRATAAAGEKLAIVQQEAAETRAQITAIIGPVDNFDAAFRSIANTSADIARGLAVAGQAADDFKQKIAGAAAANAAADSKLNSDVNFEQAGRSAGLLQAQIDYISQFENRVELLAQAKRELTAQNAAFDQALTAQEAKVGAANVDQLRRSITETFAEAERVKQVDAFRQIAADARASVNDVARFGVAQDATAASSERLATALGKILNPGAAANRTIDAIEASVTEVSATLQDAKTDAQTLGVAYNELQQAAAGINTVAGQIDGFKAQQAAVAQATAAFDAAQAEALQLAAALDAPGENAAEIARKLKLAEAAVETAGNAMQQQRVKAEQMAAALRRAGVDVDNLALAERRLTAAATQAALANTEIGGRRGGKGGLFGLNPQDATNLSYQINDIFTQLASGQSIFITLAQQGPQIWQIGGVQQYLFALKGLLIPLGAVAAGLGLVAGGVAAVYKATSPSGEQQAMDAYLTSLGEKSVATAAQLGAASQKLQQFGADAKDANEIVKGFNEAGLNPSYLNAYSEAIRNAAQVTGKDMKDASTDLTAALGGGFEAVVRLNDGYGFLSDAELNNIQVMYDSGRADEARQLIFDRFTDKYQEAADKMNGGWTQAWRNLQGAASDFGFYVEKGLSIILSGLRTRLDDAAVGVNYLILRMRGLSAEQAGQAAVNNGGRIPTRPGSGNVGGGGQNAAAGQRAIADAERELDVRKRLTGEQRKANAAIEARRKAQAAGYTDDQAARLAALASAKEGRAIADENAKAGVRAAKAGETAANKARAAREKAQREAEAFANKVSGQAESLQSALDTMGGKVAKLAAGTLQEQLTNAATAVQKEYDKLFRQLEAFSKLTAGKGMVGNQTITQYREQIKANQQILTDQAKLKVFSENINDTLAQRKQLLADIEERAANGDITGAQAIRDTAEVTSRFEPLILNLTNAAIDFARSIGGAEPSAELQAMIAKLEGIQERGALGDPREQRRSAQANIGREENKLNSILSERNSLVESYNTLQELGLISASEARKRSAQAFAQSQKEIATQIEAVKAAATAAGTAIDPQAYDALIARLDVIGAQAEYLDPRFAQLRVGIENVLSQNAMAAFDRIAQSFGNAIAGTESWGDALKNAGYALLDFIAKTLIMVGQLILQAVILNAVDKATGGILSGLLAFYKVMGGATGGGPMSQNHNGGTIGSYAGGKQSTTRVHASMAAIASAPRHHTGTAAVGLKPNEQLSVLEKGEKVMTERQQELEAQSAKRGSGGGRGIRQVLAFGDDQVAAAMAGPAGEDTVLTHLRRNATLVKQLAG